MSTPLTQEEAVEICKAMESALDRSSPDDVELFNDMLSKAVRYASIRAQWLLLDREQRRAGDESRTMAHDAFIASVNILGRLEGDAGKVWLDRLENDRKRIGDLACHIGCFLGLEAR